MSNEDDQDINNVFKDLLFAEEKISKSSFDDGFRIGQEQGNPEAYHLGYHRGAEIGSELGFYMGTIKNVVIKDDQEKASKLIAHLIHSIDSFPKENSDEDYLSSLESIRSNFKKVCALLKIENKYLTSSQLSF